MDRKVDEGEYMLKSLGRAREGGYCTPEDLFPYLGT